MSTTKHLYYLHELSDYKVASDDPDVRGWEVVDKDNESIGTVRNFLVSKEAKKVRYLDVEANDSLIQLNPDPLSAGKEDGVHEFVNKEGDIHVIIPIGMAKVDTKNKIVITTEISKNTFAKTKRKSKEEMVLPEYEIYVLTNYTGEELEGPQKTPDENFYDRTEFDESKFHGA